MPAAYLEDASGFSGRAERLFKPRSAEEVAEILRAASASGTPVTVYGAGTGLTGGAVAQGGWVLSTERLTRLEIQGEEARAEAGVALRDLQAAARRAGKFYPPDPTEQAASLGGTIATNASGARSFRYGPTRRWVRELAVVLPSGQILRRRRGEPVDFPLPAIPGPAVTKNTAGYRLEPGMDWVDLFIGSEGTLGVVVEATLALLPLPRELVTGVVFLPGDEAALRAVERWRSLEGLRMLEFLDAKSLELLRPRYPAIPARAGAALLIEQEAGSETALEEWTERLEAAGADLEGSWFAASEADRERFREFRHALPESVNDLVRRRGLMKLGSDYAVPAARIREMLACYRSRCEAEFPGAYVIFGHIGDGHLHVNLLPSSDEEFQRGRGLMVEFARRAVALGGTVSAEHGLGKRKAGLLELQYAPEQIEAMKAVKRRLDPKWILGRGNLFATDSCSPL